MYKGLFWRLISRSVDYIMDRQKEVYFIVLTLGIAASLIYGVHFYGNFSEGSFVQEPKNFADYALRPSLVTLVVVILLIFASLFFAMVFSLSALKKLKVFKMEVEFGNWPEKQRKIVNNIRFTSTVLKNNEDNVRKLVEEDKTDFPQIVKYLAEEFNRLSVVVEESVDIEADIIKKAELGIIENGMYKEITEGGNSNTRYNNSFFGSYNILLGVAKSPTDQEEVIVRIRKPVHQMMDDYDKEAVESLLAHAINLKDLLTLREQLQELGLE